MGDLIKSMTLLTDGRVRTGTKHIMTRHFQSGREVQYAYKQFCGNFYVLCHQLREFEI